MGFIGLIIFLVIIAHLMRGAKRAVVNKVVQDFVAANVARNQQMENLILQMQRAAMQHREAEMRRLIQQAQTRFVTLDQPTRQHYAREISDALPGRAHLNPETGEWEE